MAFGQTPLDGSTPVQFPMSSVIPDGTNTPTALEGGPSISSGGNTIAPVSIYVKDGNDITQGTSTDASNANSVIGQLKQIKTNTASITLGSLAAGTNTIGGVELVDSGGTNKASISAGGALRVDGSAVTQPVSGTITANAGTGSFTVVQATGTNLHAVVDSGTVAATQSGTWNVTNVSGTVSLPTGAATSAKQPALGTAGTASTDVLSVQGIASMTALKVDGSGVTQPVSGTFWQATQPISGTVTANVGTTNGIALDTSVNGVIVAQSSTTTGEKGPLIQGAVTTGSPTYTTAQTNPISLTTAGAIRVDASATTQPISGMVTANQGGTWTVQPGNTANTTAWKVDGSGVTQPVSGTFWQATQPISGTVTVNAGTNLNTSALALDTSVNGVLVAQGSTTSGEKGPIVQGAVTTNAPSYTTAQTSPISLDASGLLRASLKDTPSNTNNFNVNLAASAATVTVSGTITANAGTNLNTSLLALESGGNLATLAGAVSSAKVQANTAQINGVAPSMGNGVTGTGVQRVTISSDSTGQVTLAAGANTIGAVTQASGPWTANVTQVGGTNIVTGGASGLIAVGGPVASGASNADNPIKVGGVFNTTQPTVTNGQVVDAQMTARGARIVATGTDIFNVTVNAALPAGASTIGNVGIVAGSAVIGSTTIQATSGTALAADQSNSELKVSNYVTKTTAGDTALTLGSATGANSLPVVVASDQGNIPGNIKQVNGSTLSLGSTTSANSIPVVVASDQAAFSLNQGASAVAGTAWRTKGDFTEQASLSAGSLNADLLASLDVSTYKWMSVQLTGVWSGTLNVQGCNDNTNFVNLIGHSLATASTNSVNLVANGVYAFAVQCRYIRIRMTAYSSGTANGTVELYTSTVAVDPALVTTTLGASAGTNIGSVSLIAASTNSNGSNDSHLISAASTNATSLKASGGLVFGYEIFNTNAATRYVKLTNASSAPTPGTTAVFRTIGVPPSGRASFHSTTGLQMNTGIGFYTCTGIADSDSTAVSANDLSIDIDWK